MRANYLSVSPLPAAPFSETDSDEGEPDEVRPCGAYLDSSQLTARLAGGHRGLAAGRSRLGDADGRGPCGRAGI
jgi:hypothetical protein